MSFISKLVRYVALTLLLSGSIALAQTEGPCGVSIIFEYKVASTNSAKTGRLGFLPGSTNWYRTYSETTYKTFDVSGIHDGSYNYTYTENYPSVHHYGSGPCPSSPSVEGWTDTGSVSFDQVSPPSSCFANVADAEWDDMGTCFGTFSSWADQYNTQTTYEWEISDPPPTDSTDEHHAGWSNSPYSFFQHDFTKSLGSLYTTAELISNAKGALTWPHEWSSSGSASRQLSVDQRCISLRGMRYRIRYIGPKGETATIKWIERFIPSGSTNVLDTEKTLEATFTGEEQIAEYEVDIPDSNGETIVIPPPTGLCASCNLAAATYSNNSVDFRFGLGHGGFGEMAGFIYLNQKYPGAVHSRIALKAFADPRFVDVVPINGLRQAKAPNALVDIDDVIGGYKIDFYSNWGNKDPGTGLYALVGTPFATWSVVQVSSSPYSVEIRQGGGGTNTYTYQSGSWIWTRPDGSQETTTVITNASGQELNITRTITGPGATPVFDQSISNIVLTTGLVVRAREIIGSGTDTLTNHWFYQTNVAATHTNYGKLTLKIDSRGGWERYEYETNGLLLKRIVGFGNSATNATESQSRVFEYSYTPVASEGTKNLAPESPRTVVEKLKGHEIARTYYIYRPGTNSTIQCTRTDALPGDADNLTTTTRLVSLPNGTISITRLPAGLHQISRITTNSAGTFQTNTTSSGVIAANGMDLADGTETTTVMEKNGAVLSRKTRAIPPNIVTAHETYSDPDAYKRMRRTDNLLDGTYTYTTYVECCGQASFRDREGVTTTYGHDSLKRLLTTTRVGITTSNVYDAVGNVLETWRYSSNGPVKLSATMFDRAGRIKTSTDAMTNTTTYTYSFDAEIGRSKTTISYPDTGTRIEYHNKDGTLSEVTGTAVAPLTYSYDIEAEGGHHRAYTLETRSPATEWVKTYTDMLGRTYKEVHAAAAAPYPERRWVYDSQGRLKSMIEFDSLTNLYLYSSLGETEYSGIDMNGDGELTTTSNDRLTRTVRSYATNNGVYFERVSTMVWTTDGSGDFVTTSISETSVDGLHSWRSGPGVTNKSHTVINSATATRTVNSTNADGSYAIAIYQNGRLISQNQYASNGSPIGGTTYGYDDHGRQSRITDVRTGTETVWFFNNADQVTTSTVSAPALPAQTTMNFYDNMGRVWRTIQPDNLSVTNEYYLTGLLRKRYGAREYPVEYKYDAQGRITNMTTWQSYPSGGAANTKWRYDGYRGWLTNKLDDVNQGPGYIYNAAGWLKTRAWARGTTTTYSYNPAGELTGVDYSDATPDVAYAYDRRGRQSIITQGSQSTSQLFNDAGQLLSQTANGLTVSNSYDLYLRRTNSGVWNGSTWLTRTEYTYDNASRLQKVGDGINSATYAYVPNSSLIDTVTFKQNTATRMITTKSWDTLHRLRKIESVVGSIPVSSHSYGYNSANQRTGVTNSASARWVYQYDNLGQVTSGKKYWPDGTPVAGQQFEYSFDDIGNRKYAAEGGNEWGTVLKFGYYTVNTLNQYTQRTVPSSIDVLGSANSNATVTVNDTATYRKGEYFRAELPVANSTTPVWLSITNLGVLQDGANPDIITNSLGNAFIPRTPETFTHDLDGNQTSDGRWTNKWDAENRLISMESHSTAPEGSQRKLLFGYDAQGRRVSKILSNRVSGVWQLASNVRFVYDNWNLFAELNATNNAVIASYMWGLDLSGTEHGAGGVGGLLATTSTGKGTHFYCFDGNGNVSALTSATNGTVTAEYDYDPFLGPLRTTGPMAEFNCFTGSSKYWDREIECYYYGYRYLRSGRWLSRDPIEESGGLGLYTFAYNNAAGFIDSDGRRVVGPLPIPQPRPIPLPVPLPGSGPGLGNPGAGNPNNPTVTWTDPVAAPQIEAIRTKSRRKASDACYELAKKKPGQNQYFYAQTSYQRAMGAAAVLWKKDSKPRSRWMPPGFRAAFHNPRLSVDRGHLIPRVYGGKADAENIVTQESDYNQGHFREIIEYKLDRLLPEGGPKCNWVCIAVIPKYQPGWKPVPAGFGITIVHGFETTNYEQFFDSQPLIDGNLDYDLPPWRDMNLGWSRLNYEVAH